MFKIEAAFILRVRNVIFIKLEARINTIYFINSMRYVWYFTFVSFPFDCFDMKLLLNWILGIDDDFISINYGVFFDDEFPLVSSGYFRRVFKFEAIVICAVNDEGFLIDSVFETKLGNTTLGRSLNWESDLMYFLLTYLLVKSYYLQVRLLSDCSNLIFNYLPHRLIFDSY